MFKAITSRWLSFLQVFTPAIIKTLESVAHEFLGMDASSSIWDLCGVPAPDFPLVYKGLGYFIDYEETDDERYESPGNIACETMAEWELNLHEGGTVSGRYRVVKKVGFTWLEDREEPPYIRYVCEEDNPWWNLSGLYWPDGTLWVVGGWYFYINDDDDLSFKGTWNMEEVEGVWWEGFEQETPLYTKYYEHKFVVDIPIVDTSGTSEIGKKGLAK
jgi:hypothetical protein